MQHHVAIRQMLEGKQDAPSVREPVADRSAEVKHGARAKRGAVRNALDRAIVQGAADEGLDKDWRVMS